ncbi:MAG: hypothetical protein GX800_06455 [Clostridiaceae bacterium]|nr:hypothetical protein [Clostridiaceae bacterium]
MVIMMGKKMFRIRLFGFKKKDVNKYLQTITDDFAAKNQAAEDKINALENALENASLQAENYLTEIARYEKEKDELAKSLAETKDKECSIIQEAMLTAEYEKSKINEEIIAKKAELHQLKYEVMALKKQIINAAKRFYSDLN